MPKKLPNSMMKETVEIPVEHRIPKKTSAWVEHVREFAKQNNMKFFAAMKDPKCRESYHKK